MKTLLIMIVLDYILANEDRHLNNFGVNLNEKGKFTLPPLFDFGIGLFEHDEKYNTLPLQIAMRKIKAQPFNVSLEKSFCAASKLIGKPITGEISLEGLKFPNRLARTYIETICKRIGIVVKGNKNEI